MKVATISSLDLGINCWATARFHQGVCHQVETCTKPEKKTCTAYKLKRVYVTKTVTAKE
jgi:hypothetical protein